MRTVQLSDATHAELQERKRLAGAKRLDEVVEELLHPRPRKAATLAKLRRSGIGLQAMGVERLRLFGSVVRDEAHRGSDVDLLVDLEAGRSYFDLARIQSVLEDILGARADVVLSTALHPRLAPEILAEAEEVPLA